MSILIRGPRLRSRRRPAAAGPNPGPSLREVRLLGGAEPSVGWREGDTLRRAGRDYRVTAAQAGGAGYVHLTAAEPDALGA